MGREYGPITQRPLPTNCKMHSTGKFPRYPVFESLMGRVQYTEVHWVALPENPYARLSELWRRILAGHDPVATRGWLMNGGVRYLLRRGLHYVLAALCHHDQLSGYCGSCWVIRDGPVGPIEAEWTQSLCRFTRSIRTERRQRFSAIPGLSGKHNARRFGNLHRVFHNRYPKSWPLDVWTAFCRA